MALEDFVGYDEIKKTYGVCTFNDFTDIKYISIDTYYDEDIEAFGKTINLILSGNKGKIEIVMTGVTDFKILNIYQLIGLDITNISENKWERIKYQILDYENDYISGYAQHVSVSINTNPYL